MTTVVTLVNMPASSPTDVAVQVLDQSKLKKLEPEPLPNGVLRSVYVYDDGDPTVDTTVSYQVAPDTKKGTIRNSILLRTTQIVVVDSVEIERQPIEASLVWITPGRCEDPAKVLSMLGTLYSLAFDGVTTKVPNDGIIGSINRSITAVI